MAGVLRRIRAQVAHGALSYRQLMQTALETHEKYASSNVFNRVRDAQRLMSQADACDANDSVHSLLHGVPVAIKDNFCERGELTTCGSRVLDNFVAPYDATAVRKLRDAGAIVFGNTNMDEFGMGSTTTVSSLYEPASHPLRPSLLCGGSSGGSAGAVAAGIVPVALGSDTGGSVRQPAARCGVVALKPSYGAISRYGLVAYANSLDTVGILARSVDDLAITFDVLRGEDEHDMTSWGVHLRENNDDGVQRVLVPRQCHAAELENADHFLGVVERFAAAHGAEVDLVDLPSIMSALPTYYVLASAEAASNLARYDGIEFGNAGEVNSDDDMDVFERARALFHAEVKRRVLAGNFALSSQHYTAVYERAQQVRQLLVDEFDAVLGSGTVIAMPTVSTSDEAWARTVAQANRDEAVPVEHFAEDVWTVPASLAGLPCVVVDGVQFIGERYSDLQLLNAAASLE